MAEHVAEITIAFATRNDPLGFDVASSLGENGIAFTEKYGSVLKSMTAVAAAGAVISAALTIRIAIKNPEDTLKVLDWVWKHGGSMFGKQPHPVIKITPDGGIESPVGSKDEAIELLEKFKNVQEHQARIRIAEMRAAAAIRESSTQRLSGLPDKSDGPETTLPK